MKIKGLVVFIVLLLALTVFASECRGQVVYVPIHTESKVDSTEAEKSLAYLQKIADEAYKKDEKRKKIYKRLYYVTAGVIIYKIIKNNK